MDPEDPKAQKGRPTKVHVLALLLVAEMLWTEARAGLYDNVPDRLSAKVAPVGCHLATMALKLTTFTIPKVGCTAEVVTQSETPVPLGRVA